MLESQHGSSAALDRPMVLVDEVVGRVDRRILIGVSRSPLAALAQLPPVRAARTVRQR